MVGVGVLIGFLWVFLGFPLFSYLGSLWVFHVFLCIFLGTLFGFSLVSLEFSWFLWFFLGFLGLSMVLSMVFLLFSCHCLAFSLVFFGFS